MRPKSTLIAEPSGVIALGASRYEPPPPPADAISRDRLVAMLELAVHQRLTVLLTPPGYGKTVLLEQWAAAHRAHHVRWITIRADNDSTGFVVDLRAALQPLQEGRVASTEPHGVAAARVVQGSRSIAAFLGDLADTPPTVLVLDDFHRLTSPALVDALALLIEHAPRALRIVVATQVDPPVRFSRLRLSDALVEFHQQDLAFNGHETAELLRRRCGRAPGAVPIGALTTLVEGWAAGLEMAAAAFRDEGDAREVLTTFAHSPPVARYFEEHVLRKLDDTTRDFLLCTSVLHEMSGRICNAVLGDDGAQAMLEELDRTSTFITCMDLRRYWYRYQPLFRAFLRHRLHEQDPRQERALLGRAAHWHLAHDDLEVAMAYLAEASAWEQILDVASTHGDALLFRGQSGAIATCTQRLPAAFRRKRPTVLLLEAMALLMSGQITASGDTLDELDRALVGPPAARAGEWMVGSLLRAHWALERAQPKHAVTLADHVLHDFDTVEDNDVPNVLGLTGSRADVLLAARQHRGVACLHLGMLPEAKDDLLSVLSGGHPMVQVSALGTLALVEARCRRLTAAQQFGLQALAQADRLGVAGQPATVGAYVALAQVARARGLLDAAAASISGAVRCLVRSPRPIAASVVAIERAMLALAEGRPEAGLALLGDRRNRNRAALPPAIRALRYAAEAELLITTRDLDGAERVLARAKHLDANEVMAARMRVALERDDLGAAHEIAGQWSSEPSQGSPLPRLLWLAVLDRLDGDAESAQARVAEVVAAAEVERDIGVFLATGQEVLGPVRALYRASPSAFLRAIVESDARARVRPAKQLVEQLTGREYMVLTMLPNRLSNVEIAERLGVSLNTLKTHLKHIYRKLGVEGRGEAVAAAEQIHLL